MSTQHQVLQLHYIQSQFEVQHWNHPWVLFMVHISESGHACKKNKTNLGHWRGRDAANRRRLRPITAIFCRLTSEFPSLALG